MNSKFIFKYSYDRNNGVEHYGSSEYPTREKAEFARQKLTELGYEVQDIEEIKR